MIISILTLLQTNSNEKELVCLNTNQPIKIDAQLNEWGGARSIAIKDKHRESESTGSVQTFWNNQYLYIAFQIKDKNLQAIQTSLDHPKLYLDDMVEFLIDTQNNKDSCWQEDDIIYHINLLGQKKDDRGSFDCITNPEWNGNAEYTIKKLGSLNDPTDIDTGYIVEIRISWKELDIEPVAGLKLGFNFAVGDSGKLFDWVGASPFRSPYAFGNLILINNQQ
jgi:hypothetical protein